MKKTFACIAVLFLLATFKADAQIQRGNAMVGGDIGNFGLGLDQGGNFSFTVNPKVAWFLKDNLAVGGYFLVGIRVPEPVLIMVLVLWPAIILIMINR
jgi:hypothetical protein